MQGPPCIVKANLTPFSPQGSAAAEIEALKAQLAAQQEEAAAAAAESAQQLRVLIAEAHAMAQVHTRAEPHMRACLSINACGRPQEVEALAVDRDAERAARQAGERELRAALAREESGELELLTALAREESGKAELQAALAGEDTTRGGHQRLSPGRRAEVEQAVVGAVGGAATMPPLSRSLPPPLLAAEPVPIPVEPEPEPTTQLPALAVVLEPGATGASGRVPPKLLHTGPSNSGAALTAFATGPETLKLDSAVSRSSPPLWMTEAAFGYEAGEFSTVQWRLERFRTAEPRSELL
jgi:hypothetical protein